MPRGLKLMLLRFKMAKLSPNKLSQNLRTASDQESWDFRFVDLERIKVVEMKMGAWQGPAS